MGINRFDVASMDESLGGLANTLLQNRVLKQRAGELEADRAARGNEFQQMNQFRNDDLATRIEQNRIDDAIRRQNADTAVRRADTGQQNADTASNKADLYKQKLAELMKENQLKHGANTKSSILENFKVVQMGVASGIYTPEEGNLIIKHGVQTIPEDLKADPEIQSAGFLAPDFSFSNKPPTQSIVTEIDAKPGTPEIPASNGLLGIGAHPAVPAVPDRPKTTTTIRGNIGTSNLPNLAPAATPKPVTPKDKAALANQLAQQHPDWTRQQIIQAVNGQ